MDALQKKIIHTALSEGRKCSNCGWMITKKNWKVGKRLCYNCEDALKGVVIDNPLGWGKWADEKIDKTGEMP